MVLTALAVAILCLSVLALANDPPQSLVRGFAATFVETGARGSPRLLEWASVILGFGMTLAAWRRRTPSA
jgi:hypothetical protein